MEFVDVGYAYLAPILILLCLLIKNKKAVYLKSLLEAINVSLLFFIISATRSYYGLYLLAKSFGFNVTPQGLLKFASTNILYFAKNILMLLLPILFVVKRLSGNLVLSTIMVVFLWYDVLFCLFNSQPFQLVGSNYAPFMIPLLRYSCLIMSIYSFLWLIKRLSVNSKY